MRKGFEMRPSILEQKTMDEYKLFVLFDNGDSKVFDCKPLIQNAEYFYNIKAKLQNLKNELKKGMNWGEEPDFSPGLIWNSTRLWLNLA